MTEDTLMAIRSLSLINRLENRLKVIGANDDHRLSDELMAFRRDLAEKAESWSIPPNVRDRIERLVYNR